MSKIIRSSDVITINDYSSHYRKADSIVEKSMEEAEAIIRDANEQSIEILEKAKTEAENLVSNAVSEAERAAAEMFESSRERGYAEGHSEGYEKGYAEGHSEGYEKSYTETTESRKAILDEANEIKKSYLEERTRSLEALEPEIVKLVKEVCEKVINSEMEREDYMVDLILKGIASLSEKDNLIIRVSKEDYKNVMDFKPEILSRGSLIEDIDIKLDSNLQKGDCVIESAQGNVNSSISLQIEEMKKILDDLLLGE
ncbi:V-type proton ATPase subunit E [Andreesenia angusta]|uniref:V-type proton ATPase subunit E n=1 Tax=Andreesenia angusta TaxID=39480 RepID=A0A1S1V8D1_9FIRM|nr:FliH/SctL family protein [Andreesenia angusta]OHW62754.1 V-type proton ATPase subunit E [Andreesenia angusta]